MTAEVRVERVDHLLVITIDRPERRNAVTRAVGEGIASALDLLDADPELRVGILTGAGGVFCAGRDLKSLADGESVAVPGRGFGGLVERSPAKPLIAAVEGFALGGGMELALASDLVVAGEGAVFGLPEVTRGLVARAGGLLRLGGALPPARAMEIALIGGPVAAGTALEWGLINRVVPDGMALQAAIDMGAVIASNAPLAVVASKRVIRESADWRTEEAFQRQAIIADPVFESDDANEGARAFLEKRAASWAGR